MRIRRFLALTSVISLVAGVVVFATSAGAAAPTLTLTPKSGPAGTAITVKLSTPCKMPNLAGIFGGVQLFLEQPGGAEAGSALVFLAPGQSLAQTILNVDGGATAGHYFVHADCAYFTGATFHDVEYTASPFQVTGGPALPTFTISKASGPVGTVIDVSAACAPSIGEPSAFFSAALFSPANAAVSTSGSAQGVGPVQHVKLTVPPAFQPGTYPISASCSDYDNFQAFAERSFRVLPGPPAAPGGIGARPGPTTSKTVGPIVVTYATALNHGYAITKYTATCTSTNGGVRRAGVHVGATAAPITVANATLKKTYRCVVTSTNAKGNSPASRASEAIIVGAPAKVGRPTATRIAAGKVRVGFPGLTVAQTNGAPLITPRYSARCVSGNGGITRAVAGGGSPIVVGALTPGRIYMCTVVAHNARGWSAPSAGALVTA